MLRLVTLELLEEVDIDIDIDSVPPVATATAEAEAAVTAAEVCDIVVVGGSVPRLPDTIVDTDADGLGVLE